VEGAETTKTEADVTEIKVFTKEQVDKAIKTMRAKHDATKDELKRNLKASMAFEIADDDLDRVIEKMMDKTELEIRAAYQA
jgi:uncharacterized protein YaaR (DUF327 family)